jgi:hypothetical protein
MMVAKITNYAMKITADQGVARQMLTAQNTLATRSLAFALLTNRDS